MKYAQGSNVGSNAVTNTSSTWEEFCAVLMGGDGAAQYTMSGECPSGVRGVKHGDGVIKSSLLYLDFDDAPDGSVIGWEDFCFGLEMSLDYKYLAHTTKSYDGSNVAFRVIVPLDAEIDTSDHRAAVEQVVALLPDEFRRWLDKCSYLGQQLFFTPNGSGLFSEGGDKLFTPCLDRDDGDGDDDFEALVKSQPLDLTDVEVAAYLGCIDPDTLGYGADQGDFGWADVGMGLAHQYQGSDKGYEIWRLWSAASKTHDEKDMRQKYNSFSTPRSGSVKTFRSIIKHAGTLRAVVVVPLSMTRELIVEASTVSSLAEWDDFKYKIQAYSTDELTGDNRVFIAAALWEGYGRQNGLTMSDVKKALTKKREKKVHTEVTVIPEWLEGWCYISQTGVYYHGTSGETLSTKGFNDVYGREKNCAASGKVASEYALHEARIPHYSDCMFWPGAATTFSQAGLQYVNSYKRLGVTPATCYTPEGLAAVEVVKKHFDWLTGGGVEYGIVMDWIAHVYQHPGQKVIWALLIQGTPGCGKTYLSRLLNLLMGRNINTVDAAKLGEKFNSWASGSLVNVVEEVKFGGEDRYAVLESMKSIISNREIQVESKGKDLVTAPNFTSYLLLTNHRDALPIDEDDRRYCVISSPVSSKQVMQDALGGVEGVKSYFDKLFDATDKYADEIAKFFGEYEISAGFGYTTTAPETDAKRAMIRLARSESSWALGEAIEAYAHEPSINERFVDVTLLRRLVEGEGRVMGSATSVRNTLVRLGYERSEFRPRTVYGDDQFRSTIWVRPGTSDSVLRAHWKQ